MKKLMLVILVLIVVFSICLTVAYGVPDDFEILKNESKGVYVFLAQMRLRDLGYMNYRPTGQYYSMSETAVREFQEQNELPSDGHLGAQTYEKLFANDAVRKPLSNSIVVKSGPSAAEAPLQYGELADWYTVVDQKFPVGATATVTDYNSGKSFNVKRTGGEGHADVEAVDADAYAVFLECFGGEPNWEKRSVLVKVGSSLYAASLFGNPSGESTITTNDMDGSTCLYFSGSTSDVLGFVDKEHQRWVLRAAGLRMDYSSMPTVGSQSD